MKTKEEKKRGERFYRRKNDLTKAQRQSRTWERWRFVLDFVFICLSSRPISTKCFCQNESELKDSFEKISMKIHDNMFSFDVFHLIAFAKTNLWVAHQQNSYRLTTRLRDVIQLENLCFIDIRFRRFSSTSRFGSNPDEILWRRWSRWSQFSTIQTRSFRQFSAWSIGSCKFLINLFLRLSNPNCTVVVCY